MAQHPSYSFTDRIDQSHEMIPLLKTVGENISIMQKMVDSIGSKSDTISERRKFLALREDVKAKLVQAGSAMENLRLSKPEIEREIEHYVKVFRGLLGSATTKFSQIKPYDRRNLNPESVPLLTYGSTYTDDTRRQQPRRNRDTRLTIEDESKEPESPEDTSKNLSKALLSDLTMQSQERFLEEQHGKMNYIQSELLEMKDLYEEMDYLVNDQQESVDTLQGTTEEIRTHTYAGNAHLLTAEKYVKKVRRNRCFLLLFLFIVSAVLAAFIWVVHKNP